MSARSADTARERGRTVTALLAASATTPSNPWSRSHKSRSFNDNSNNIRGGSYAVGYRRPTTTDPAADDQTTTTDCGETTLGDGDDDLVGVVDRLLSSRGQDEGDSLDLCSSTWQSVETMARALATGQSIVSTISRCYRLPGLGRNNSGPQVAAEAVRCKARRAGTEAMHSLLLSGRFAAKALAIFRRLGQAPLTHPDSFFINSSKLPEAAKALDPGLDDATIRAWMKANGFEQQGRPQPDSLEALSWTEYRQALSELCPAFRRHGISPTTSTERNTAVSTPIDTKHIGNGGGSGGLAPSASCPSFTDHDPWEAAVDRTPACPSPARPRRRAGLEDDGDTHAVGGRLGDCPPRSPGADSYGVLRRKRLAAVSLDYEAITRERPQVMPPLDPSILVDHIKAQGRRDRKNPGGDEGGRSSLWTLSTHERLLKIPLEKEQVLRCSGRRLLLRIGFDIDGGGLFSTPHFLAERARRFDNATTLCVVRQST
ncbi:unnamed protein product [Ectocarpus sp. 6 AP-2014]